MVKVAHNYYLMDGFDLTKIGWDRKSACGSLEYLRTLKQTIRDQPYKM